MAPGCTPQPSQCPAPLEPLATQCRAAGTIDAHCWKPHLQACSLGIETGGTCKREKCVRARPTAANRQRIHLRQRKQEAANREHNQPCAHGLRHVSTLAAHVCNWKRGNNASKVICTLDRHAPKSQGVSVTGAGLAQARMYHSLQVASIEPEAKLESWYRLSKLVTTAAMSPMAMQD